VTFILYLLIVILVYSFVISNLKKLKTKYLSYFVFLNGATK